LCFVGIIIRLAIGVCICVVIFVVGFCYRRFIVSIAVSGVVHVFIGIGIVLETRR